MNNIVTSSDELSDLPSHRVMEQAAEWYARLKSDELTEAEQARWRIWLAENPQHRLAWGYVESISRRFEPIQTTPDPRRTTDGLLEANSRLTQRRLTLKGIACLASVGLLGWGSWRYTPLPSMAQAWQADHRTTTGEIRDVLLSDSTRIWLNTATAINQHYDSHTRQIQLVRGEILIDTASDPSRPFIVETPQGRLQAMGTRFTVNIEDNGHTYLAVYEGAVKAHTRAGAQAVLQTGQQTRFSPDGLEVIQPANIAREAWSRGILVAEDIPLREVVAELRRYRNGHLGIAPEVANLRVLGQFPLYDSDKTLDMIAAALPVYIHRPLPWWVSIEARK